MKIDRYTVFVGLALLCAWASAALVAWRAR